MNKTVLFSTLLCLSSGLFALETPKTTILANGLAQHHTAQKSVSSFQDMFQKGNFYGRLRSNNFYFWFQKQDASHKNSLVGSLGASFVYKSAVYKGFDFTAGLYSSQSFFDASQLDSVSHLKAAKDTLSRFEYINTGSRSLYAMAQANISYRYEKNRLTAGRQLVETFYTKSNDTKMIPNSFDGFVLESKALKNTQIKLAYLAKQKLRDHKDAHAVLMVGDANLTAANNPQWSENDDSAMHKGLTYSALKHAGKKTDAPLLVLDAVIQPIKNLKINFSAYSVPSLLSQAMGEMKYKIPLNGFTLTPAIRYIQQFDNGAGTVGGASLYLTGLSGYKDPNSLDSGMIAAKVVAKTAGYKVSLAYTQVLDKADLVNPWRGFPTAGYTRSMGVYNWRANVKSYRIELVKGAQQKGLYTHGFIQTSILYVDADQSKNEFDKMVYYFGYIKNLQNNPQFQYRLRIGYNDFVGPSSGVSNYVDSRFELNYLF